MFIGALGGHLASTVSIERLRRLNPAVQHTVQSLSFLLNFDRLTRGVLEAQTVFLFVSMIVLALWINVQIVDAKKAA